MAEKGVRVRIVSESVGKGFKDANKALGGLKKAVGALGLSLSAAAIANFGKNAAKAFIEDERAAAQLAQSVKNLGLAFDLPVINAFIDKLTLASGVADDKLRPSMQKLLQVTGSVSKSQELLIQALDISRGSGIEFETVIQDLASAYVGNTKGLKKYNLGISKAELSTISFADAQKKLTNAFKGANAAYLDTYAGKIEVLTTTAGEAKEIIGQGLIDALMTLSGDTTVQDLADTMLELSNNTADALRNLGKFGKGVQDTFGPIATVLEKFITTTQPIFNSIVFGDALYGNTKPKATARRFFTGGQDSTKEAELSKARAKAESDALKRAKLLASIQVKTLADAKKKAALDKASKTLDLERIGLTAALKNQISETDRISLQLQLALLDKNDSAATKLSAELETATKRQQELSAALLATPEAPNPFRNWKVPTMDFGGNVLGTPVPNFTPPAWSVPNFYGPMGGLGAGVIAGVNPAPVSVTVTLDGQELTSIITDMQVNDSLSGTFSSVNRSGGKGAVAML